MSTENTKQPATSSEAPDQGRCAVASGSASAILSDLVDDPQDNGEYSLNVSGMSLALLWEAIQKQEAELRELRKDKARLDSGEIMHRCCGDRVHFVKQDLRAAIDEALSQNSVIRPH
jgi:hypothetical protein